LEENFSVSSRMKVERKLLSFGSTVTERLNTFSFDDASVVDLGKNLRARYGLCPIVNISRNPANPHTHSKKQIRKIARSMEVAGPLAPVIVDENYMVWAGEARLDARLEAGHADIPVVQVFGLSEAQKRAFLLADNRIAADAGWDRKKLAQQIPELTVLFEEAGLTIEDTGFEIAEIDEIVLDFEEGGADADDAIAASILNGPPVLRVGDLVTLGDHRLVVGDARDSSALDRVLAGQEAAAAFLDPPYNVPARNIGGRGQFKHEDFAFAFGEMSRSQFVRFLIATLEQAARVSRPGAVHFVCMDGKHIRDLIEAGDAVYEAYLDLVTWVKTNAGQGGLYRKQSEFIGVFRVGRGPNRNNVQMGKFGRNRSNVWTYAGANTLRSGRMDDLAAHPTVKPLRLVADALKDVTAPGEIVLDTFAGSGTTILAADRVGRQARALEIDPKYADIAVRRWQSATGRDAVHLETGLTFGELQRSRAE
jgi:DNA modification methylase